MAVLLSMGLSLGAQNTESPSGGTTTLNGKIVFEGTLPLSRRINMAVDPGCVPDNGPSTDELDVMVYAKPLTQTSFPPPGGVVILEYRNCRFVPHTLTMQVGQKFVVRNSDFTAHNLHARPTINTNFNVPLPRNGSEIMRLFDKEEGAFSIRCDVHNWEAANVGVFLHPYHTVSKLNGTYSLALPPGLYEFVAWHEKLGGQTQTLQIGAGQERVPDFIFK
jgi:hypothetical protein